MGDCCSANTCASDLSEEIGLVSTSIACTSYAADGKIKHM